MKDIRKSKEEVVRNKRVVSNTRSVYVAVDRKTGEASAFSEEEFKEITGLSLNPIEDMKKMGILSAY